MVIGMRESAIRNQKLIAAVTCHMPPHCTNPNARLVRGQKLGGDVERSEIATTHRKQGAAKVPRSEGVR